MRTIGNQARTSFATSLSRAPLTRVLLVAAMVAGLTLPASAAATIATTDVVEPETDSCVSDIADGEICLHIAPQCELRPANPDRAGIVDVHVTNGSSAPIDVEIMVGNVGPRSVSADAGSRSYSTRVTGRADGVWVVTATATGAGIIGGSAELPSIEAVTWCDTATLTQRDCTIGFATAELTIDNTLGNLDLDLTQTVWTGDEPTNRRVGTVPAGSILTLSIDVAGRTNFFLVALAAGAPRQMQRTISSRSCVIVPTSCSITPTIPVDECNALFDVAEALGWDRPSLRLDLCTWDPVTCSNGHVTELSFIGNCQARCNQNRVEPKISPSIGELRSLERLRIVVSHDRFERGRLPSELGQLSNLVSLVITNVRLVGEIPPSFGNLTSLQELVLGGHDLVGELPATLSNLRELRTLDVRDNEFRGPIPEWLGELPQLRRILLDDNFFTGTVPASLFRTPLWELGLSDNQLDSLPATGGPVMREEIPGQERLQEVRINRNNLTGPIPAWFSEMKIQRLDLRLNNLSGALPDNIGSWDMEQIVLSYNDLSGPIPASIGSLSNIERLELAGNQLSGSIPAGVANIGWLPTNITRLDLSGNDLTGPMPSGIAAPNLRELVLNSNAVSGTLDPAIFAGDLSLLNVWDNQLTGPIPETLGPLTTLWARDNSLTGPIPPSIGPLVELNLSNNDLTGVIPAALFEPLPKSAGSHGAVWLDGNQLSGPLPENLADFGRDRHARVALLPNGCLTASPAVVDNLSNLGIDTARLCDEPSEPLLCRGEVVTVDLASGERPTSGDDVILGTAGDDEIVAGDGDDLVCGGPGDDKIWGQNGDDEIHGDGGNDRIRGGAGPDVLYGGAGEDDMNGGTGNDEVWGEGGADTLRGGTGNDLVHGGDGDDPLIAGNGGVDQIFGGPGRDRITGGPRGDTISGGNGADTISGNGGPDTIAGDGGDDFIYGGPQSDVIDAGDGNDRCYPGLSNAVVPDLTYHCEILV